jgi:hypothetical protein
MEELELYPHMNPVRSMRSGLRTVRSNWKAIATYFVVVGLVFGWAGYRWLTTSTAVDQTHAIELFRAERGDAANTQIAATTTSVGNQGGRKKDGRRATSGHASGGAKGSTPVAAGQNNTQSSQPSSTSQTQQQESFSPPQEGVYSWDTDGYEQVSGARRQFPEETQRILTWNGNGYWTTHHYFSEQHEIWTDFHWGSRGAEIVKQRNKITFGPVTNDSTIDFNPPMLVGPRDLKVGYEWGGKWEGETHGDYSSKVFEHTTMDIGGERVEVWGMSYIINLHGKQEGKVQAEVWLAPESGLTVKEHYVQDVQSSGAQYHAEWTQQLKSMHPEQ